MSKKYSVPIYETELSHKKVPFLLKPYYEMMHEWFMDNGFKGVGGGDNYLEPYYHEIRGNVKEIWFWWRGTKSTESSRIKYKMNFDVHVIAMSSKEVMVNNKKMKLDDGEVVTTVKSSLVFDLKDVNKTFLGKIFYDIYIKRWMQKRFTFHKKEFRIQELTLQYS